MYTWFCQWPKKHTWWWLLTPSCDFVDPKYNIKCNEKNNLTKIIINIPNHIISIVKHACIRHGDERFNYLSSTEIKLIKEKDMNKISYREFADSIKIVRWNKCRRCNATLEKTDVVCCIIYFWTTDIRISMRRSFLLHQDCTESELKLYKIYSKSESTNIRLEKFLNE